MRIAMVSEHASPLAVIGGVDAGGQNVHVAALAAALGSQGHDVVVYTRRTSPSLPDRVALSPGVIVEHVLAGPPTEVPKDDLLPHMAAFARILAQRWRAERVDVVHSHFWMSGLASVAAARSTGLPVVHTYHALGTVKRRHQGARDTSPLQRVRLERALGRDVSRVVATCSDEAVELLRMGVPRTSIDVIPCGVDVGHFRPDGAAAQRGPHPQRLLTVSRLVERKGDDDVIRALARVPDAELVVVGGPDPAALNVDPDVDPDFDPDVERLRTVAREHGVADRVSFRGRVPRADMPALFRSADAVVCAPWYEPFGMVALEAMACGVPVVASAVGGLADTVADGVTGVLVPPRSPAVLGQALRGLLGDPRARRDYGRAGAARARARYSWERIAADTLDVYSRVRQHSGVVARIGVGG